MAKDITYRQTDTLNMAVPAGIVSGNPFVIGNIPVVALTSRDSVLLTATVLLGVVRNVANVSVEAVSVTGSFTNGSAVAIGDKLYIDATTHVISKDTGGILFGWALAAITSDSVATIDVLMA